jgi:cell division protein FtsI (penicillin-binding protein 3)
VTRPPIRRLLILFVIMVVAFAGIVVRLAFLQVRDQGGYAALGYEQRVRTIELPARRGEILDRTGTPLAITMEARDVYADPQLVTDPSGEAVQIAPLLGLKPSDVRHAMTSDGSFVYIQRQVDLSLADRLAAMNLPGIDFLPVPKRNYPAGGLAPQVLGYVGVDGVGLAGLEDQYDAALRGSPGTQTQELSPAGLPISTGIDTVQEPIPGVNLVTTIDRQMQYQVQTALADAVKANGAKGGTVVVMDPATGDVYAMATYPWFDPNHFSTCATDPDPCRNRAATDEFEPGSVNKIITAAAALETGKVSLSQTFRVPYAMDVGPFHIQDAEVHPVETMTLGDIIAQSSNIGAAMVAQKVGSTDLARFMDRFGYGHTTGLGFPGEAAGKVPTAWDDVITATAAYGQGVAVTPLQMADVYATIANGGRWIQPRLVRGSRGPNGVFHPAPPSPTHQVIRPQTARELTSMLANVVAGGTGAEAQIPGYQVAGKTGTARKLDASGTYINRYMASFVGFLPARRPRLVISVSIDEPRTVYGGIAAAPLFSQIARYAIQRLGIPAADPLPLPPTAQPTP